MDKLEKYRQILQKVVTKHAQYKSSHREIESLSICDIESDNYLLMDAGWDRTGRVHFVIFHLRIIDEKIWIEWDGIEYGIVYDLLEAGIPQEDIVLAFHAPETRALIPGFALN